MPMSADVQHICGSLPVPAFAARSLKRCTMPDLIVAHAACVSTVSAISPISHTVHVTWRDVTFSSSTSVHCPVRLQATPHGVALPRPELGASPSSRRWLETIRSSLALVPAFDGVRQVVLSTQQCQHTPRQKNPWGLRLTKNHCRPRLMR